MRKAYLTILVILLIPVLVWAQEGVPTDEVTAGAGTDMYLYASGKLVIMDFSKHVDKGGEPTMAGDFNYWDWDHGIGLYDEDNDIFTVDLKESLFEGANRLGIKTKKGWIQASTFGKHVLIRRTSQKSASGQGDPVIAVYREGDRFTAVPRQKSNELIDRQVD